MSKISTALVFLSLWFLIGCDEEQTLGTLRVELWGEEFIEDKIPADEFADEYSVTFDKFLINLGKISVSSEGETPAIELKAMKVWDLTKKGPFDLTEETVPTGKYVHTAYRIQKATSASAPGNADESDVELIRDNSYSVYVKGEATNGEVTKQFAWGFTAEKTYDPCHSKGNVTEEKDATVQVTIHGDHLFYDDAVGSDPDLRFEDIARADADEDGEITADELAEYDITVLPNYLVGSLDIDNLWDFISHMTSTLGHIDGEGHCE